MRRILCALLVLISLAGVASAQVRLVPPKVTTLTGLNGNQGDIVNLVGTGDYLCSATTCTSASDWKQITAGGATGAPTDATYITKTANSTLSAEQALGALATGLMNSTTTTGVVSTLAPTDDNLVVGSGAAWELKALTTCTGANKAVTYDASANTFGCNTISPGTGDVVGPGSATADHIALFNGTTGKLIKDGPLPVGSATTTQLLFDSAGSVAGFGKYDDNDNNIFIGSGFSVGTGFQNIGIGDFTLASITTGHANVAIQFGALGAATTGHNNVAIANGALSSLTTGSFSTAVGNSALAAVTIGDDNTAFGSGALSGTTLGTQNTAIGLDALNANTTGSDNVGVGYDALIASGNLTNAIVIGANSLVSASNRAVLGNASVTDVYFGSESAAAAAHAASLTAKLITTGTAPTVANVGADSCGTTAAAIAGNSNTGEITVGATAGTQCRITFPAAAAVRYNCTCSNSTTAAFCRSTFVDTTHSDILGAFTAGDVVEYICLPR